MSVNITVVGPPAQCGEGPHWEEETQSLLYVDLPKGIIHRYFPDTGIRQQMNIETSPNGPYVTFVLPITGHKDLLLVGHGLDMAVVKWDVSKPTNKTFPISSVEGNTPMPTRFNDGKCDPQGRVWAGTMAIEVSPAVLELHQGSLYRYNQELQSTHCVDKISISNGLAWSEDKKTFYYIDSCTRKVECFDYDDVTGNIGNRRTVLDYETVGLKSDLPDGMTIDVDGNLWVANYAGAKMICVDPNAGKILRTITFPAENITSACWGGRDYSTLFVTSATQGLTPEELAKEPLNGSTFAVTGLGTKGKPPMTASISSELIKKIQKHFNDI